MKKNMLRFVLFGLLPKMVPLVVLNPTRTFSFFPRFALPKEALVRTSRVLHTHLLQIVLATAASRRARSRVLREVGHAAKWIDESEKAPCHAA